MSFFFFFCKIRAFLEARGSRRQKLRSRVINEKQTKQKASALRENSVDESSGESCLCPNVVSD